MLDEHGGLATAAQAEQFLRRVAIALRYGASAALPMASMYHAVWRHVPLEGAGSVAAGAKARRRGRAAASAGDDGEIEREAQRRATVLTNALIERGTAIEINAVADRVAVAHRSLVPALFALGRRGADEDDLDLSPAARRALAFIAGADRPTAGQVRAHLGVPPRTWPNPADDALAELQRVFLIDRGAAEVPDTGAPYLARDGIPYRVFARAHPEVVAEAAKLSVGDAAMRLIAGYLAGAVFAAPGKLASLFKRCLSRSELDTALAALADRGEVAEQRLDGKLVVAWADARHAPGERTRRR